MLMNETEELLYRRIRAYSFDGGDTRPSSRSSPGTADTRATTTVVPWRG